MADVKFNFTQIGEGQPLVILHGLLGSAKNWQQQAKALSKNFSVYCIDLPNHGQSYRTKDMTYPTIASQINQWVEQTFEQKPHLMGHSMGGKIAMKAVDSQPDLYKKMIVVDISPVTYPLHHLDLFDALQSVPLNQLTKRQDANHYLQSGIESLGLRNFLMHSLKSKDGIWNWEFDLQNLINNQKTIAQEPQLKNKIANPTLFIKGENSTYIQPAHKTVVVKHYQKLFFKKIANAGHWPHSEKAKVFTHIVNNFLLNETP